MPHTEDELLRASGCNEADDSATIPSDLPNNPLLWKQHAINNGTFEDSPTLEQAITMHAQELADLEAECGRTLTVLEATAYRLRQLKNRLVDEMLRERKPVRDNAVDFKREEEL